jgi:ethanolamine utilization protein EutP (predicted NTPase)
MDGKDIYLNLQAVLEEEERHEWTEAEIKHQMSVAKKKFNSRWNPDNDKANHPQQPAVQQPLIQQLQNALQNVTIPPQQHLQIPQQPQPITPPTPTAHQQQDTQQQNPPQQYFQQQVLPQATFTQVKADSKLVGYVDKRYKEEMKFSGNLYDVLNTKLLAFYDICRKVDLPKEQYHKAYSIMLSGQALDFYYNCLSNRGYDFDTMV